MQKRGFLALLLITALGVLSAYFLATYLAGKDYDLAQERSQKSKGWEYYNSGRIDLAIEEFSRYIRHNERNEQGYLGLGWSLLSLGNTGEAGENFRKAIALNPNDPSAYAGAGWVEYRNENYGAAIALFTTARDLRSSDLGIYDGLGRSHYKLKQFDEAIEAFSVAESIDGSLTFPKAGKFMAYYSMEDDKSAQRYLNDMIPFPVGKSMKTSSDLRDFTECVDIYDEENINKVFECSKWY